MTGPAIEMQAVVKRFGDHRALDGMTLAVPAGTVFGLLGPNGAGKTTSVNVLSTLLAPDEGRATVAGFDVVERPDAVRASLGLTGQFAAVDDYLTGRENLVWFGRLNGLGASAAVARADELLEAFALVDAADKRAKGYSGGMRRRLDLAASLVVRPSVLALDEPTTGLDPRSRRALWDVVRGLKDDGVTILLTTQYLEEADELADGIAVVDRGRVIAEGTARSLKDQVGGAAVEVVVAAEDHLAAVAEVLERVTGTRPTVRAESLTATASVTDGVTAIAEVAAALRAAGVEPEDLGVRRPSLDEVFLALTGAPPDADAGMDGDVASAPVDEVVS
jgi:ABC-2 type transport system ATP-binding protein